MVAFVTSAKRIVVHKEAGILGKNLAPIDNAEETKASCKGSVDGATLAWHSTDSPECLTSLAGIRWRGQTLSGK